MVFKLFVNTLFKKGFRTNQNITVLGKCAIFFSYLLIPQILKFTRPSLRLIVSTNFVISFYFKVYS